MIAWLGIMIYISAFAFKILNYLVQIKPKGLFSCSVTPQLTDDVLLSHFQLRSKRRRIVLK